jgi:hypothetical protein
VGPWLLGGLITVLAGTGISVLARRKAARH